MNAPAELRDVTLDDKYTLERGRVYLTGVQALVRLPMMQRQRDRARASTPPASSPATAARRSAASTRRCGSAKKYLEQQPHPLPAGRQRGPRRDRGLGHAAGQPVPGAQVRRRVRACGTARARASTAAATCSSTPTPPAPRKHGGVLAAGRRRPRRQVLDAAAPERARLHRCDDPGAEPGRRAGVSSISACTAGRCRATPAAGSASRRRRDGREPRRSVIVDPGTRDRSSLPERLRDAAGRPQHPLARPAARAGSAAAATTSSMRRSPSRAPTGSTASSSTPEAAPRHRHHGQEPISTCARRSTTSASTTSTPPRSASASTRSACPGRWSPRACASSPQGLEEILVVEEKRAVHRVPAQGAALQLARRACGRASSASSTRSGEWVLPHGDWLLPAPASSRRR